MMWIRLLLTVAVCAGCGSLHAESKTSDWRRVTELAPTTEVEVIHGSLQRVQGLIVVSSEADITLQSPGVVRQTISRADVLRVTTIGSGGNSSRKRRILIGLAIGAAAGAATLAAGAQAGDMDIRRDLVVGAGAAIGGGVGALVGAAIPHHSGPRIIYRRPSTSNGQ